MGRRTTARDRRRCGDHALTTIRADHLRGRRQRCSRARFPQCAARVAQTGTDADLVVFDEARVTDQATYVASTRPSSGIDHVIVGGTFVVHDGELVPDALPGRPVRASPR
jgi:N-acyl-D-aspartate/D-glutamate deacylase